MIGTPFGPEYSCLAVGKQEIEISESYHGPFPELYKRYIDDVFGATSMSREDLERFIGFVSNFTHSFNTLLKYLKRLLTSLISVCQ